jgi:transposase
MGSRKPYSDEFRQEAVRLVTEQGMPSSRVARELGIDPETLRRWLRAQTRDPGVPTEPVPPAAELARLRREVEQLRMERDILKKALGIFSRMPQ